MENLCIELQIMPLDYPENSCFDLLCFTPLCFILVAWCRL